MIISKYTSITYTFVSVIAYMFTLFYFSASHSFILLLISLLLIARTRVLVCVTLRFHILPFPAILRFETCSECLLDWNRTDKGNESLVSVLTPHPHQKQSCHWWYRIFTFPHVIVYYPLSPVSISKKSFPVYELPLCKCINTRRSWHWKTQTAVLGYDFLERISNKHDTLKPIFTIQILIKVLTRVFRNITQYNFVMIKIENVAQRSCKFPILRLSGIILKLAQLSICYLQLWQKNPSTGSISH